MRSDNTPKGETCKWPVSDRPGCVSQPRLLTPPLSPRRVVPMTPCLTSVCGLIPGIMLMVEMSELSKPSKPEEDLQDPGEAQGPEEAQLLGAEAGRAASASASSSRSPAPPLWRPCPRKLLMRW